MEEEDDHHDRTGAPRLESVLVGPAERLRQSEEPVFVTSRLMRFAVLGAIGAGFSMAAGGAAASALWHLPGRTISSVANFATSSFKRRF